MNKTAIGLAFIFSALIWLALNPIMWVAWGPDSFAYYLLGKSIFMGRGYTTNAARDFYLDPTLWPVHSRSFPPLLPFLLGLVDWATHWKIRSGYLVNLAVLFGWFAVLFQLARRFEARLAPSFLFLVPLFILCTSEFQDELVCGRSIPLALGLFLAGASFFLKSLEQINRITRQQVLLGIILCALTLTRFDNFLFAIALPFILLAANRALGGSWRTSAAKCGIVLATFVLIFSPWGIRNLMLFGAPFASDNTGTATSTYLSNFAVSYWTPSTLPPSLKTDPNLWFHQRWHFFLRDVVLVWHQVSWVLSITASILIMLRRQLKKDEIIFLIIALLQGTINLITVAITPYTDLRYFDLMKFNLLIATSISLLLVLRRLRVQKKHGALIFINITLCICLICVYPWRTAIASLHKVTSEPSALFPEPLRHALHYDVSLDWKQAFYPHLEGDPLVAVMIAEPFHYYTGLRSIYYPFNTNFCIDDRFLAWLEKWRPDFLALSQYELDLFRLNAFTLATDTTHHWYLLDARRLRDEQIHTCPASANSL